MIIEKYNYRFDTLLQPVEEIKTEGYTIEFASSETGFLNPENKKTYLPGNISTVEIIGLYAPLLDRDGDSILYLLITDVDHKGWISDSYSIYTCTNLTQHITNIRTHF